MSMKNSALAAACCAVLLAAPLALAQSAAAHTSINSTSNSGDNNGPKTPEEAAACKALTGSLLGGFGSMLGNAVCVVRPAGKG
ncbi:hypothetical protein [Kitasatospora sp. NPDC001683]